MPEVHFYHFWNFQQNDFLTMSESSWDDSQLEMLNIEFDTKRKKGLGVEYIFNYANLSITLWYQLGWVVALKKLKNCALKERY